MCARFSLSLIFLTWVDYWRQCTACIAYSLTRANDWEWFPRVGFVFVLPQSRSIVKKSV